MDTRLRTIRNTALDARPDQRLPRPQVQTLVVRQPVSLRPMGNTIALRVPAEMPFHGLGRPIRIYTQASGGMAKADPMMRSRRLRGKIPFDGMGGLGDVTADAGYMLFNKYDPDAANMSRSDYDNSDKKSYWEGQVTQADINAVTGASTPAPSAAAAPAPASGDSGFSWSKAGDIFSTVTKAGTDIYGQIQKAKTPTSSGSPVTRVVQAAKSNMTPILVVGGLVGVGLLAYFMLRKKGAAAAA